MNLIQYKQRAAIPFQYRLRLALCTIALLSAYLSPYRLIPQCMSAEPELVAEVEGISEYRFENGLRLVLYPDASKPKITVNMTVLVGSRHEGAGEGGMAHLLEHMLFKGTPLHADIPKQLKDRGATFNGSTNVDRTNYYETLPDEGDNLEFAIRLEADRMMNSYIRGEDLASEMTVVRNEFERSENDPGRVLQQKISSAAYQWHNYGRSTIGNRADIERVPLPNLRAFYRKYYQPDNVVVIITGSFEVEEALDLVNTYFGSIPRPERILPKTYTVEPPQDGERRVLLRRVGDLPIVSVAYHVPAAAHPDSAALQALGAILSRPPSGRLYQALVETKLASSASGSGQQAHDPGLFRLTVNVSDVDKIDEVEEVMLDVIENLSSNPVTEEELKRAQTLSRISWERFSTNSEFMAMMLSSSSAIGDWRLALVGRDRLQAVTTDDIQSVASKYFVRNNRVVGRFIPTEESQRVDVPTAPSIASIVDDYQGQETLSKGERLPADPLAIEGRVEYFQIPGGPKVAMLPKKTRGDRVIFEMSLDFGNLDNLQGKQKLGRQAASLMRRATEQLSRQELDDKLDAHSATLSLGGSIGQISASVETKGKELPSTLELLRQVLHEPAMEESEFELNVERRIDSLIRSRTNPQLRAGEALAVALDPYPQDDLRATRTVDQNIAEVEALTIGDVRQFYADFIGASNGQIAIVGQFDPDEIKPILLSIFAGWESPQEFARIAREPKMDVSRRREIIQIDDKDNATYSAGMPLKLSRQSEDYPALFLAARVLGSSGLSSRLGNRVRQKEGLSYGVSAGLSVSTLDENGLLSVRAIVNPTNADRLVEVIDEELEKFVADGVTQEELDDARDAYLKQRSVSYNEESALAGMLLSNLYWDRDMSYQAEFEQKLRDVTVEDVKRAIDNHLDLERMVIVTAGDFNKKEPGDETVASDEVAADGDKPATRRRNAPRGEMAERFKAIVPQMIKRMDKNDDGKLSEEEVTPPPIKRVFKQLDTDEDGLLTEEELLRLPEVSGPPNR